MAGPDQMVYSKQFLHQFKQDYNRYGKYNLEVQVPHLARLAEFYHQRYRTTKHRPDCVKAHALYNSIVTREPNSPGWKEKVFAVQQDYCDINPSFDFQHQQDLTNSLKADLQSIRIQSRKAMVNMDDLAQNFDDRKIGIDKSFFERMKGISVTCSERMAALAGRVIRECIDKTRQDEPPCDFEVVSIGSLARGEATPYSDLEYLFLVEDKSSPETLEYFEYLAITSYFQVANLGETKLAYMSIAELEGWFSDTAKNGFKIDGLAEKAGNIPTGNGSSSQRNHFIVTPQELAEHYREVLENPDRDIALRGDLTAMLTYMKPIFTHKTNNRDLLMELKQLIQKCSVNEIRRDVNRKMLETDVKKFNFTPNSQMEDKGFAADVKKEIYRFPSILLLDIAIVTKTPANTSWESVKLLHSENHISEDVHAALELLLAAATYIRLSAYLYHDSQDDRMSVSQEMTQNQQTKFPQLSKSQRRWFVPSCLFIAMCSRMILLKRTIAKNSNIVEELKCLALDTDDNWPRITTLYYTGRRRETLNTLRQIYGDSLCDNPISVTQNMPSGQSELETLDIISETLFWCDEYGASLVLNKHMTDNNISDERRRIEDCYKRLGDYNKAATVLESITDKSAGVYYSLGSTYRMRKEYNQSELSFIQALELYYTDISSEEQYDYYGDPIATNEPTVIQKISFTTITSPEERLSRIVNSTPDVIVCVASLGDVYVSQGQYTLAESYYKKALHLISELYGEGAAVLYTAQTLNNLGNNYIEMGHYSEAEDSYKQALAIKRNLSQGADSGDMLNTLNNLGANYRAMGQYSEAVDSYKQALAIYRILSKGADSSDIALTLKNLGINYNEMGHYSEAEDSYKQALAIKRNLSQGADSGDMANTLNNLGVNYIAMGQYSEAEESFKQTLAIYRNLSQGAHSRYIADTLNNLGINYNEMGQYSEAEDSYKQALTIYRNLSQGADSSDIADALYNLGINYNEMGQYSEAEDSYKQALTIYRNLSQGADSSDIANTLYNLGISYNEMGQYSESEDSYKQALVIYRNLSQGADSSDIARALSNLGNNYNAMGQYSEAADSYEQALAIYRNLSQVADSRDIVRTLNNLGYNYRAAGDKSKAVETYREALDMYIRVDPGNPRVSRIRDYLSSVTSTSSATTSRYLSISKIYRCLCKPNYYIIAISVMIMLAAVVRKGKIG